MASVAGLVLRTGPNAQGRTTKHTEGHEAEDMNHFVPFVIFVVDSYPF